MANVSASEITDCIQCHVTAVGPIGMQYFSCMCVHSAVEGKQLSERDDAELPVSIVSVCTPSRRKPPSLHSRLDSSRDDEKQYV